MSNYFKYIQAQLYGFFKCEVKLFLLFTLNGNKKLIF